MSSKTFAQRLCNLKFGSLIIDLIYLPELLILIVLVFFSRRDSMSWYTMLWDIFIIFLGLMFGLVGMYYSGRALERAYELGIPV